MARVFRPMPGRSSLELVRDPREGNVVAGQKGHLEVLGSNLFHKEKSVWLNDKKNTNQLSQWHCWYRIIPNVH